MKEVIVIIILAALVIAYLINKGDGNCTTNRSDYE